MKAKWEECAVTQELLQDLRITRILNGPAFIIYAPQVIQQIEFVAPYPGT